MAYALADFAGAWAALVVGAEWLACLVWVWVAALVAWVLAALDVVTLAWAALVAAAWAERVARVEAGRVAADVCSFRADVMWLDALAGALMLDLATWLVAWCEEA